MHQVFAHGAGRDRQGALAKAVAAPDNWKRFEELGYSRVTMTPEQFDGFVAAELQRMKPVIAETGVVVD